MSDHIISLILFGFIIIGALLIYQCTKFDQNQYNRDLLELIHREETERDRSKRLIERIASIRWCSPVSHAQEIVDQSIKE